MRIEHIDEVLPHIEGRSDFIVMRKDGYTAVDYVYTQSDSFDHPVRAECRGLKFHTDGRILARPFQKFFNLGEKQTMDQLPWDAGHIVLDKLDGSMIHPAIVHKQIRLMTRAGITDVALKAEERFSAYINYGQFCHDMLKHEGLTPIFEFTAPDNRIVIRYDQSALTLIGLRDTIDGMHMPWRIVERYANSYDVPVVGGHDMIRDASHFEQWVRGFKDKEGVVVRFENGHMVKIKAEDYLRKHRAKDDIGSKKKVLEVVLRRETDDFVPLLDDGDRKELLEFHEAVWKDLREWATQLWRAVDGRKSSGMTRKEFAAWACEERYATVRPVLFKIWDDHDAIEAVVDLYLRNPDLVQTPWRNG